MAELMINCAQLNLQEIGSTTLKDLCWLSLVIQESYVWPHLHLEFQDGWLAKVRAG